MPASAPGPAGVLLRRCRLLSVWFPSCGFFLLACSPCLQIRQSAARGAQVAQAGLRFLPAFKAAWTSGPPRFCCERTALSLAGIPGVTRQE